MKYMKEEEMWIPFDGGRRKLYHHAAGYGIAGLLWGEGT
jgi:hypothetical protein